MNPVVFRAVIAATGAATLSTQISGGRLLAPDFGSSVFVWGALIGVFLTALSLGSLLGGLVADRWSSPDTMAVVLATSGIGVFALPYVAPAVVWHVQSWQAGPRLGPLLASLMLFTLPVVLLAACTPIALRLTAVSLGTLGNAAGVVYAVSTCGGIAGTLITAFFLVPVMSAEAVLAGWGAGLFLTGAAIASFRRGIRLAATGVLVAFILIAPGYRAPAAYEVVHQHDSLYHRIRVVDRGTIRHLVFNRSFQGGMDRSDPLRTPYLYTDYVSLAWVLNPQIRHVLVIGLGVGTIPRRIVHDEPRAIVEVAELDPSVVDVARHFFDLQEGRRLKVTTQDGRVFLQRSAARYDLVVVDAYFAEGIPFHLATREFFLLIRQHLAPGGIVAANIVGAVQGPRSGLFRALYKTYGQVFLGVHAFPVRLHVRDDPDRVRTIVVLATVDGGMSRGQFLEASRRLASLRGGRWSDLDRIAVDYYDRYIPTDDVPAFTDDFAPADVLPVAGWEPERP